MKSFIIIAALFVSSISHAQTVWEKVDISSNLSISFPSKPAKNELAKGQNLYILKHADSTSNYIVVASDLGISMGIDEATLTAEMDKEESWEQAKTAFIGSMGPDVTLLKDELTTLKGNKALHLTLDKKIPTGDVNTITVFIFVHGTISYNLMFVNRAGKASVKMKDQFFDSIEIK